MFGRISAVIWGNCHFEWFYFFCRVKAFVCLYNGVARNSSSESSNIGLRKPSPKNPCGFDNGNKVNIEKNMAVTYKVIRKC